MTNTKGKATCQDLQLFGKENPMTSNMYFICSCFRLIPINMPCRCFQKAPNQFYGAELECYAYYKSLRDYKLVEDTTHSPPFCLTVNCTGRHTTVLNVQILVIFFIFLKLTFCDFTKWDIFSQRLNCNLYCA